jgi:hypothetical protein
MTKTRAALGVFDRTATKPETQAKNEERPDRAEKTAMPFWVPRTAKKQLRVMAAEMETTQQQLIADALNDFFRKHGKPPIA